MTIERMFEYATDQDPALNYCLWPYSPPSAAEDKFRSINLLYQTFDYAGIDPRAFEIVGNPSVTALAPSARSSV